MSACDLYLAGGNGAPPVEWLGLYGTHKDPISATLNLSPLAELISSSSPCNAQYSALYTTFPTTNHL